MLAFQMLAMIFIVVAVPKAVAAGRRLLEGGRMPQKNLHPQKWL